MTESARANGRSQPVEHRLAELHVGEQVFTLDARDDQELTLGRHSEDRRDAPDVDLGDLPRGRTVSRRHARLYQRNGRWFLRVEHPVNPTLVDGQAVEAGRETPLANGQEIQFGGVAGHFHQIEVVDENMIPLTVQPDELRVEPGGVATALIRLVNATDRIDRFRVDVVGLPREWYSIVRLPPAGSAEERLEIETDARWIEVGLYHTDREKPWAPEPGAEASFLIAFRPPRSHRSTAGTHPFEIRVTTRGERRRLRSVGGKLTVTPFQELGIVQLPTPPPRLRAEFAWDVTNQGNRTETVVLSALSLPAVGPGTFASIPAPGSENPEDVRSSALAFQWAETPPAAAGRGPRSKRPPDDDLAAVVPRVVIGPGAAHRTRLRVRVTKQHWWGSTLFYPFDLTAQVAGEADVAGGPPLAAVSDRASIACPPRIPEAVQNILRAALRWLLVLSPIVIPVVLFLIFFLWPPEKLELQLCTGQPPTAEKTSDCSPGVPVPEEGIALGDQVYMKWAAAEATFVDIEGTNFPGREIDILEKFKLNRGWWPRPPDEFRPIESKQYTLIAKNPAGVELHTDRHILVHRPPTVEQFMVNVNHLTREGEPVVVRWKVVAPTETDEPYVTITAVSADTGAERTVHAGASSGELVDRPEVRETHYRLQAITKYSPRYGVVRAEQIVVVDPPGLDGLTATPASVVAGREAVRLRWTARGASSISIRTAENEKDDGTEVQVLGPDVVEWSHTPSQALWYTVTAANAGGQASKRVPVVTTALAATQVLFRAEPDTISRGEAVMLVWQTERATAATISPGVGEVSPRSGNVVVRPETDAEQAEYKIAVTFDDGTSREQTVRIRVRPGPIGVDFFTTTTPSIEVGETATLSFSVQNAKEVVLRDGTGKTIKSQTVADPRRGVLDSVAVTPDKTMVYVLTARNDTGQITQPVTIEVRPKPTPTPPAGAAPAPPGAAAPAGAPGAAPAGTPAATTAAPAPLPAPGPTRAPATAGP
ncbi:MAG TPA: FHA domain-containing protein [Chloroflexota bacterium]|jgi:hypothetical protein